MRPDNWYGYNELGAFYGRQGKYPQALTAYNEALHITPDNAEIYSNLAAAYLDAGGEQSNTQAEQALRKSIALSPSYPAYANLGLLYMHEKRYSESAGATEQALKLNGNNYLVWNNLMLAGDWTATGLPPGIEGAIRSGQKAADTLLNEPMERR